MWINSTKEDILALNKQLSQYLRKEFVKHQLLWMTTGKRIHGFRSERISAARISVKLRTLCRVCCGTALVASVDCVATSKLFFARFALLLSSRRTQVSAGKADAYWSFSTFLSRSARASSNSLMLRFMSVPLCTKTALTSSVGDHSESMCQKCLSSFSQSAYRKSATVNRSERCGV